MSRKQLAFSIIVALIFAIPMVTFISVFAMFPLIFYALVAVFVIFGWIPLFLTKPLERIGIRWDYLAYAVKWQMFFIIWAGCAFGLSHWGMMGSAVGAKNEPYLKVFLWPAHALLKWVLR